MLAHYLLWRGVVEILVILSICIGISWYYQQSDDAS
jgi:hypothetical protein